MTRSRARSSWSAPSSKLNRSSAIGGARTAAGYSRSVMILELPTSASCRLASERRTNLRNVMRKLNDEGVQAIVLDFRDNAGGSLGAAVAVCEMLLPAGKTIVETRGRDQVVAAALCHHERWRVSRNSGRRNRESATAQARPKSWRPACRITSRAVVVGERSFGKGTVQQVLPLESGKSLLKLTWAGFWRPNGGKRPPRDRRAGRRHLGRASGRRIRTQTVA